MGHVEVARPTDMRCCKCDCPEESTTMRYVYFDEVGLVMAYCADHYRDWMIAVHGEETVKMLEESTDWHDEFSAEEV